MDEYQDLINLLNEKRFHAEFFEDVVSAKQRVMELIADADSIGIGGSQTIKESGLFDEVVATGKTIYSQTLERKKENPDNMAVWRSAMGADVYLTSTNALTREGDLINIDGNGNRVAAMFFGPDKVVVLCGTNKISKGPHDAIARIKKSACPKNAKRLGLSTPCATEGVCRNCDSPERMCKVTVRIQYPPKGKEIHILLVNDALGF
ncbi:lactate utilization protein [Christensenella tenuis]|uniref:Lactate utilization protein n=1 Tax=Christensenella tenuis TaxID=2763033 RepID=A0ABR7EDX4_9FIRM|nr:lactate utilization protein [Christensenella tenuis]MBC5647353.1 lactate utilization protein [Christensenella tenuis]